jgi:hypothetical protein
MTKEVRRPVFVSHPWYQIMNAALLQHEIYQVEAMMSTCKLTFLQSRVHIDNLLLILENLGV